MAKIPAPVTLDEAGSALWDDVTSKYALRADELRTLEDACTATDMIALFTEQWREQNRPLTSRGSMGQEVEHPLIGSIDKQRKARQMFLKQLHLPDDSAGEIPNQAREAATASWAPAAGRSRGA